MQVQLPFAADPTPRQLPRATDAPTFPTSFSILAAASGLIADLTCRGADLVALTIDYDPGSPPTLTNGTEGTTLPPAAVAARVVPSGVGTCHAGP